MEVPHTEMKIWGICREVAKHVQKQGVKTMWYAIQTNTENLFPGYIFVQTQCPEEFYRQLKAVSQYTRFLGKEDGGFYAVSKEEEIFLKRLLNKDSENTVRLSTVQVDKDGSIAGCEGALKHYLGYVVKKRIRLRFVMIRVYLFGREREIKLGIRLEGDPKEISDREVL